MLRKEPDAKQASDHFYDISNRDDPFSVTFAGVLTNPANSKERVRDILTHAIFGVTHDPQRIAIFIRLVSLTMEWLNSRYDELCAIINKKHSQFNHDQLMVLPEISYTAPG